jgi:hypothetical protein
MKITFDRLILFLSHLHSPSQIHIYHTQGPGYLRILDGPASSLSEYLYYDLGCQEIKYCSEIWSEFITKLLNCGQTEYPEFIQMEKDIKDAKYKKVQPMVS